MYTAGPDGSRLCSVTWTGPRSRSATFSASSNARPEPAVWGSREIPGSVGKGNQGLGDDRRVVHDVEMRAEVLYHRPAARGCRRGVASVAVAEKHEPGRPTAPTFGEGDWHLKERHGHVGHLIFDGPTSIGIGNECLHRAGSPPLRPTREHAVHCKCAP